MRLIDADALLENNPDFADRDFIHPMYDTTLRDIVDDAPTIDAVPVVRCKDCKHRPDDSESGNEPRTNCPLWCGNCFGINDIPDDFYCKYGERSEG